MGLKQLTRSRLDETPANEWDIPHYASWEDGSEYEVFFVNEDTLTAKRRFHGPMFGLEHGEWKTEWV